MRMLVLVAWFLPSLALAATGSIDVQVQNAPGEIVLDGFPTEHKAPAVLENVPIGAHVVELEYGCMVGKAEVTVAEGAKAVVKMPLQNRGGEGTLRLKGNLAFAEVLVDGAPMSKAAEGVKLPCGARRVEVSASGFTTWSEVVVITTGKWTTIEPKLVEEVEEIAPQPKPQPKPVVSELDDEEEEDVAPAPRASSTRPPVRDEFDDPDERDPDDDMDEDERLAMESEDSLDERESASKATRPTRDEDEDEDVVVRRPTDEEEEEEEPIRRDQPKKPAKEHKPFPTRGVLTVGLGAAGVTGVAIGAVNTPSYIANKNSYELVAQVSGPTSPQAIALLNGPVAQSKSYMMTGYVLGGLGVAGSAAAFLLIPGVNEKDAEDLVFAPTPNGFVLSGRF